jgi:hypothetical protein
MSDPTPRQPASEQVKAAVQPQETKSMGQKMKETVVGKSDDMAAERTPAEEKSMGSKIKDTLTGHTSSEKGKEEGLMERE